MANKLMVVAHPDDEVIFGGAHLLRESNWRVVCVTNASNPERKDEFERIMRWVGADYDIWNYRDTYSLRFDRVGLRRDLQRLLQTNRYAIVVTHGLRGEYGHPQHKVIARMMRGLVTNGLYAFSTSRKKLPEAILDQKRELIEMYPSQKMTISELCRDDGLQRYIEHEYFVRVK